MARVFQDLATLGQELEVVDQVLQVGPLHRFLMEVELVDRAFLPTSVEQISVTHLEGAEAWVAHQPRTQELRAVALD